MAPSLNNEMDITEAIKARRSVRSYTGRALSTDESRQLRAAVDNVYDPFDTGEVTISLVHFDDKGTVRPSTYGVIKGACDFLLMGMGDNENAALSAGFRMEQIVLMATQMGLGTCWIAATFDGTKFSKVIDLPEGETLKIISPVGEPGEKPRMLERITRTVVGSDKRKPFGELFFDRDFGHALSPDNSKFGLALEMMRLAPSAMNGQPWRAVVCGDTVHFFCKYKKWLNYVDMGIGFCHFDMVMNQCQVAGHWYMDDAMARISSRQLRYIRSFR